MFNRLGHSTHLKSDQIVVNPSIAVLSDIRKTAIWITDTQLRTINIITVTITL